MKSNNVSRSTRTEVRVAKTLLIMISAFTSTILLMIVSNLLLIFDPSLDTSDIKHFNQHNYGSFKGFSHIANVVLFYNSFWNFFIYQSRDRDFKKSLKRVKAEIFGSNKGISLKRMSVHATPVSRAAEVRSQTNASSSM